MKKTLKKIKYYLVKDGLKSTVYLCVNYIIRKLRINFDKKYDYLHYKIKTSEYQNLTEKNDIKVYIAAAIPYYDIGGGQRCSQLAKTFNKMGYAVRYIYTSYSSDRKNDRIIMPLEMHTILNKKVIDYIKHSVKENDLFIFEAPLKEYKELLDIAINKNCKIIYENIDNWETSLGKNILDKEFLKKVLSEADLLVGTAKPLVKQLEEYLDEYNIPKENKKIEYLANAVDEEIFCGLKVCEQPKDLMIGTKTFLYYGSLWGEWFSWDLVLGLAKRHPDYSINLIGNYDNISKIVQESPDNIHFLGLKKQADLPAYLQYVDYALIPFERGKIGDYVSPLKIFEYISMYTNVISTSLPDVKGYPNVYLGDTVEEWEKIIEKNHSVDRDMADAFIECNTWSSRVTKMLKNVYGEKNSILEKKLAVIILNYNNKNIIFKCINTLLLYKDYYQYDIIVVDNGSTDGSYEMLLEKYSSEQIALYKNVKNGCASGRNLGVSKTNKEYILFLDSDQWITNKYWLKPYEEVIQKKGTSDCIGWAAGFFLPSGSACHTVDDYPYRYMPPQMLCRSDIGYLGSGGMLMKTDLFREIGGFDTYYDPTCYEDTDLSLKIRNAGKELYYCPYLGVIHLPHQTTKAGSDEHLVLTNMKEEYFMKKWKTQNPDLFNHSTFPPV